MLTIREIKKVESLEEAWTLNQKKPNKIIGGMIWLKMETLNIGTAIDLTGLGLNTIEETEEEFRIGCMVTLRQFETHPGLDSYSQGAVREAVHHIVGLQLRNLATVGGSVFGRFGFSDVISVLLAMDSYVELYKGGIIPLRDFVNMKYDRDVLVRIIVKKEKASFYYQSVRIQTEKSQIASDYEDLKTSRRQILFEEKQLKHEKKQLTVEISELKEQVEFERNRLKEEEKIIEQKKKIIEQAYSLLEADRNNIKKETRRLEIERENLKKMAASRKKEVYATGIFFRGVNNPVALKKRYKELIKIYHPDNVNGDTDILQKINEEYEELRQRFDYANSMY